MALRSVKLLRPRTSRPRRACALGGHLAEVYFKLDVVPGADVIAGTMAKRSFADSIVSSYQTNPQRIIRSKQAAAQDGVERFCLVFPFEGTFEYRQRGRENRTRHGGVYILNAAEPYELDVLDANMVCIALPGDLLRDRIRGIDDLCGAGNFADAVMTSSLRHLIAGALREAPRVDPARLQATCLDMIELMVAGTRKDPGWCYSELVRMRLAERAKQIIRERLADPGFDVAEAAGACAVSTRQLQKALKANNTTFGRELMEARLSAARQMLRSRSRGPLQVGSVAADCGFVSQAHFANRYKERFARSPKTELDAARQNLFVVAQDVPG